VIRPQIIQRFRNHVKQLIVLQVGQPQQGKGVCGENSVEEIRERACAHNCHYTRNGRWRRGSRSKMESA
jgi:hypothetical protein